MRALTAGTTAVALAAVALIAASPAAATDSIPDTRFRSIAAGNAFASAISTDGDLYTWGSNADGQLGTGATDASAPTKVTRFPGLGTDSIVLVDNNDGAGQSLALSDDGKVYAWGRGMLGDGSTTGSDKPVAIPVLSDLAATDPVVQVSAGDQHDIVLTRSGHVYTWGNGRRGALGTGDTANQPTPVDVTANIPLNSGEHVTQVSAGFLSSVVVTDQGRVLNWGGNVYGDLGDGTKVDRNLPAEVVIPGLTAGDPVLQASLFSSHTIVRTGSGALFGWGANAKGAIGDGSTATSVLTPVAVAALPGLAADDSVVKVAAGQYSTLALTKNGEIYSWGFNNWGQLGVGDYDDSATPVKVAAIPAVLVGKTVDIAEGGDFSLALTNTGEVFAWGNDTLGGLGDRAMGDDDPLPQPIVLGTMVGSVSVSGDAYAGLTVTAVPSTAVGDWHPAAVYDYQWLRDGVPIVGATAVDYTLTDADVAKDITVQINGRAPNWAPFGALSLPVSPVTGVAPTITSGQPDAVQAGDDFSHKITATGDPTPVITVADLPAGLSFDPATGLITGTVAVAGTYEATVTANNGIDPAATQVLTIVVTPVPLPIIVPDPGPGSPAVVSGTGNGGDLAQTGLDLSLGAAGALVALLAAGGVLMLIARRKTRA